MQRILLAYSGGLDTSLAIPWLRETYGADVIAVTVDLGQGLDLAAIHERALALGAVRLMLFKGDCRIVGRQSPFWTSASDASLAAVPAAQVL